MKKTILLPLLTCLFIFAQCKKDKNAAGSLPPATQTGENTFGCLINGEVFVPKGYDGTGRPNPHVQYDYDLNGQPYLAISANLFNSNNSLGEVLISFRNLTQPGFYQHPTTFNFSVGWPIEIGSCSTVIFDTTIQKHGGGTITKLDISNRIISGTFDFKYKTLQCDTVFITDGRFDIKF